MKNKKALISIIIVLAVVIIDQLLKIWVKTSFFYGEEYRITNWFRLVFIENNGMAFGMEIVNKLVLTLFRIIAGILFVYYILRITKVDGVKWGYLVSVALITAGTIGNAIDCTFYGVLFDNPPYPFTATFLPPDGGYGNVAEVQFFGTVISDTAIHTPSLSDNTVSSGGLYDLGGRFLSKPEARGVYITARGEKRVW